MLFLFIFQGFINSPKTFYKTLLKRSMKTFLKHKKQSTFRRFQNVFQKRSKGFYETFTKRTENVILLAGITWPTVGMS